VLKKISNFLVAAFNAHQPKDIFCLAVLHGYKKREAILFIDQKPKSQESYTTNKPSIYSKSWENKQAMMVSFAGKSSTIPTSPTGGTVGRYKAVIAFLIVLQATTMWTTTSVKKRQQPVPADPTTRLASSATEQGGGGSSVVQNNKQDFLRRSQERQQRKMTTKKNSRISTTSSSQPDVPQQCMALMQKFHELNERYRNGDDENEDSGKVIKKPLINYAYYKSQGFGRLVDHSTAHCLLALAMDRPCAIDFTDRDPYFTWRHFIHTGTYNWEMTNGPNAEFLPEVSRAISLLDDIGDNSWKDEKVVNNSTLFKTIRLMQTAPAGFPANPKRTLPQDYERHMQAWSTINGENINNKALLSPNWGSAWFPQLQFPEEIQGCNKQQLHALMQNALYQPTPLSLKLHHERMVQTFAAAPPPPPSPPAAALVAETERRTAAKKAPTPPNKEKKFIVNQQQQAMEKQAPYGAIHIRTVILKSSVNGEERVQNLQNHSSSVYITCVPKSCPKRIKVI
jgi:hypothetical protein